MSMNITRDAAVTLRYRVSDPVTDQVLDSGTSAYLHGGYDDLFPKAEAALEGKGLGQNINIELSVDEAYGERNEALAIVIPRSEFPPGIKVGGRLQGAGPDGPILYRVVKIKGQQVFLDANPPLAGKAISLAATVLAVRPATAEEIAHRHVHGEHGHQH